METLIERFSITLPPPRAAALADLVGFSEWARSTGSFGSPVSNRPWGRAEAALARADSRLHAHAHDHRPRLASPRPRRSCWPLVLATFLQFDPAERGADVDARARGRRRHDATLILHRVGAQMPPGDMFVVGAVAVEIARLMGRLPPRPDPARWRAEPPPARRTCACTRRSAGRAARTVAASSTASFPRRTRLNIPGGEPGDARDDRRRDTRDTPGPRRVGGEPRGVNEGRVGRPAASIATTPAAIAPTRPRRRRRWIS